jgi:hypothetical protein
MCNKALTGYALFVSDGLYFHDLVHHFFKGEGGEGPAIEAAGSIEGVKKAVLNDRRAIGLLPAYSVAEEFRTATFVKPDLRPAPAADATRCAAVAVTGSPSIGRRIC